MRKGIVLQIIIILLLLIGWNLIHLGYDYFKYDLQIKLAERPIILISNETNSLISLKTQLDSFDYIDFCMIESDSLVSDKLIANYGFTGIKDLIYTFTLPSILKIYITQNYKADQKEELENLITNNFDSIIINYDHNFWKVTQSKLQSLDFIYKILNGLLLILFIFITVFLRIHFEHHSNEYWRVFGKSGGSLSNRGKQFWLNSLQLFFAPLILTGGIYFSALYLHYLQYEIPYWIFGVEASVVLLSILISRLFLRGKI